MRAYRVEVIRRIEERAIAVQGVDVLMQRAAAAVAASASDLLRSTTGGRYGRHVLIMVGVGNNGGDALFAAYAWPIVAYASPQCDASARLIRAAAPRSLRLAADWSISMM